MYAYKIYFQISGSYDKKKFLIRLIQYNYACHSTDEIFHELWIGQTNKPDSGWAFVGRLFSLCFRSITSHFFSFSIRNGPCTNAELGLPNEPPKLSNQIIYLIPKFQHFKIMSHFFSFDFNRSFLYSVLGWIKSKWILYRLFILFFSQNFVDYKLFNVIKINFHLFVFEWQSGFICHNWWFEYKLYSRACNKVC